MMAVMTAATPARSTRRLILFRFHRDPAVCHARIEQLRSLNPGVPIHGLYGGPQADARAMVRLPLDELFTVPLDDAYWKWRNGDLCVRWWYRELGRHARFDVAHVVEWDLLLLDPIERLFGHVTDGVAVTHPMPTAQRRRDGWHWVSGNRGWEWDKLHQLVEETIGPAVDPVAGLFPGVALSREFLDRFSAVEVPSYCNDETRVPLYAQAFGMPVHDTRIQRDDATFNCEGEDVDLGVLRAAYAVGVRIFHPVREVIALDA